MQTSRRKQYLNVNILTWKDAIHIHAKINSDQGKLHPPEAAMYAMPLAFPTLLLNYMIA